jgi:hypothetical protein
MPRFSKFTHSFRHSHKTASVYPYSIPCATHALPISSFLIWSSLQYWKGLHIMKLPIMKFSPHSPNFLPFRSTYFQHHALNTLSLQSSLHERDKDPHLYITTGKIRVLYILLFTFVGSRQKDERFRTEGQQTFAEFNLFLISSWTKIWIVCSPHI